MSLSDIFSDIFKMDYPQLLLITVFGIMCIYLVYPDSSNFIANENESISPLDDLVGRYSINVGPYEETTIRLIIVFIVGLIFVAGYDILCIVLGAILNVIKGERRFPNLLPRRIWDLEYYKEKLRIQNDRRSEILNWEFFINTSYKYLFFFMLLFIFRRILDDGLIFWPVDWKDMLYIVILVVITLNFIVRVKSGGTLNTAISDSFTEL